MDEITEMDLKIVIGEQQILIVRLSKTVVRLQRELAEARKATCQPTP